MGTNAETLFPTGKCLAIVCVGKSLEMRDTIVSASFTLEDTIPALWKELSESCDIFVTVVVNCKTNTAYTLLNTFRHFQMTTSTKLICANTFTQKLLLCIRNSRDTSRESQFTETIHFAKVTYITPKFLTYISPKLGQM
nr:hypothetical protein [Cressdnaviricota sp.]